MTQTLRAGGARWRVVEGVPADLLFGPEGLRLAEWIASGKATEVKVRPHRGVWRVVLPELDFYVKCDHPERPPPLRRLLRLSASRAEFERGLEVAGRGIPTPEPLACGENVGHPATGFLLTRTLPAGAPLDYFLETSLPALATRHRVRLRQCIARALGRFLALLHDAGVTHRDLHPGNLLVRVDAAGEPHLSLIDLRAVRLGRPLGYAASVENLAVLNRWFVLRSDRSDRMRCWRAYEESRDRESFLCPRDRAGPGCRDVERATESSNLRFWANRDRRCLGTNRYFRRVRTGGLAGHAVADLTADALQQFVADPDAPFRQPGARLLKDSASATVAELELPTGHGVRRVIYKRFAVTARTDPWTALVRPTPALRSWVMGHALLTRLLPTPRPLAVLHRIRKGLAREGYLLTELVPAAVDLASYVSRLLRLPGGESRPRLRELLARTGRLLRTLHQRRMSHRDLKAANLLLEIAEDGLFVRAIWIVDLVGVRRHSRLRRSRRVRNLARLNASFHRHPVLTRTDRLRALRAYLAWGLDGRLGWKRWWREIELATEAKVSRNQRSGRELR